MDVRLAALRRSEMLHMDFSVVFQIVVGATFGGALILMFGPWKNSNLDADDDNFMDKNGRIPGDW